MYAARLVLYGKLFICDSSSHVVAMRRLQCHSHRLLSQPLYCSIHKNLAMFSAFSHVNRQHPSDIHGIYGNKSDDKEAPNKETQTIELTPSRLTEHRINTPVVPKSPSMKPRYTEENDFPDVNEQFVWDCDDDNVASKQPPGPDLLQLGSTEKSAGRARDRFSKRKCNFQQKTQGPGYNQYNYGLPGPGKQLPPKRRKKKLETSDTKGEILFGLFPVLLALQQQRRECHTLYIKKSLMTKTRSLVVEILELADSCKAAVQTCDIDQLDELSQSRPHQGVCLDASKMTYEDFEYVEKEQLGINSDMQQEKTCKVWVLLDAIQDPMNFGAVLRSAYFLGVDKVLSVARNSCALSPVVSKASAGALELKPVYAVQDAIPMLKNLMEQGWRLVGSISAHATDGRDDRCMSIHDLTVTSNTILLLGNEGAGLSPNLLDLCDVLVTIDPGNSCLNPRLDSLNVSVATGFLI